MMQIVCNVAVFLILSLGFATGDGVTDSAFVGGLIAGGIVSIGKKLIGKAAKKEIGRVAARGGALSGPVRTALPPMGGQTVASLPGKILRTTGGLLAGGAAAAGVDRLLNGTPKRKYRRMQVTNMKALDRALRRVDGFQKRVKKAFVVSGDLKPRKRGRCR